MTYHEFAVFEEQINIALLNDIIYFIADTAKVSGTQMSALRSRCIFLASDESSGTFQEKYGFLYLGELLERYEERYGLPLADLRAIALALGYAKDMIAAEMFVGNQRSAFLKKLQRAAEGDVYLTGALYLLFEGQADGVEWMEQMNQRQYEKTEELIFVLSLDPRFDEAFLRFKPQLLSLLGRHRTMPVLGNTRILDWLIPHLQLVLKGNRAKDLLLFRALCALPSSYVKEGSRQHRVLLDHGYTNLEIAYANMMAVKHQPVLNWCSIVVEKIVIALFQTALAWEDPLPEEAYRQLSLLFAQYEKFKIKCYGYENLLDALCGETLVKNPATFIWFSEYAPVFHPVFASFDILDPHWDALAAGMEHKKYVELFECSLTDRMDAEALKPRIARFDQLTGKDYVGSYWEDRSGTLFSLLVKTGIIDLWQAFLTSLDSESSVTKPNMVKRIDSYVDGAETIQAFHFYEQFFSQYGFEGLTRYFEDAEDFISAFAERNHYNTGGPVTLKLRQDYLDDEKRLLLISWLEEYFFTQEPKFYLSFVLAVLKREDISALLGQQTGRQLFDLVIDQQELVHGIAPMLKKIYLTQEEKLAEQDAQTAKRIEREHQEHLALVQSLQEGYQEKTDGTFGSILQYMEEYRYASERRPIVGGIVREQFPRVLEANNYQISAADSAAFLLVCANLIKWGVIGYTDAQEQISNTKIKEVA
jgi:hypothetical protein